MTTSIRPLRSEDKDVWRELYDGYLRFYEANLSDELIELAWIRLIDPGYNLHGLVADVDGEILGITHYSFQTSTWATNNYCYLEDLFVSSDARGKGIGRSLIDAVIELARHEGSNRVYWNTDATNATARKLYDTYSEESGKVQYRIELN